MLDNDKYTIYIISSYFLGLKCITIIYIIIHFRHKSRSCTKENVILEKQCAYLFQHYFSHFLLGKMSCTFFLSPLSDLIPSVSLYKRLTICIKHMASFVFFNIYQQTQRQSNSKDVTCRLSLSLLEDVEKQKKNDMMK